MSDCSKFSPDGSEFIINTPFTPRPWINYLTNGNYCSLCSHVGGGFSFFKDHRFHSVLRRGEHVELDDLPGRLLYIKDEDTGEAWTANVHPIGKVDEFEARHGMGYTSICSRYANIGSRLTFFVSPDTDTEFRMIDITNHDVKTRRLSLYSVTDFMLGNIFLHEHERQFAALFNRVSVSDSAVSLEQNWWSTGYGFSSKTQIWPFRVHVASAVKPERTCTDRNVFFGAFRNACNPIGIASESLPESDGSGKDMVVAYQWHLKLEPGETWNNHEVLMVEPRDSEEDVCRDKIEFLRKPQTAKKIFTSVRGNYRDMFNTVSVETPESNVNAMMNWWNKYQLMVNLHFGRGPSYYHKGQYPAMRDGCQDIFGIIPISPSLAKEKILRLAHFFSSDGRSSGQCNRIGLPEQPHGYEPTLWFALAVNDYLRETGDFSFLDENVQCLDQGESSIYEKMISGLDCLIKQSGSHGLPLMKSGDWNDAANGIGKNGKGESVWLAEFLYFVIHDLAPIMERRNDMERLTRYKSRAEEIRTIINTVCWDGEWFVRAFRDDGSPVGVRGQKEGFIWINSQTWAVIAGISDSTRLNQCLDSVERHLGTPYGLANLRPAYTKQDPEIGIITSFRAGWKENGAVFSHSSAFNVVARALMGRGRDATDLYRRIMPANRENYLLEPYVYGQFSAGPDAGEEYGRGAFHWLTGTAAWMFRAMTDYIIGVRATYDGLTIQPAVDPAWKSFSIKRTFRSAVYNISFNNPDGVEGGIKCIRFDGAMIDGCLLPLPTKKEHQVEVTLGSAKK